MCTYHDNKLVCSDGSGSSGFRTMIGGLWLVPLLSLVVFLTNVILPNL